ncbi:FadR/GntR family transcriptional regulator [Nonomuraea recticatena]|uniref:FadR/GntR family transcriptional regulator n=1 Tax=Nonomuraea recticatena TaxID=46178 RepID=UPI00361069BE
MPESSGPSGALPRDREPLGTRVAALITEHIGRHGLADGDELPSEAKLAEEYGVSQRIVRDALRALSQQGVIRTRQGKRAVVSELRPVAVHSYFKLAMEADGSAIDELIELRLALETKAAGLAATRISPRSSSGCGACSTRPSRRATTCADGSSSIWPSTSASSRRPATASSAG